MNIVRNKIELLVQAIGDKEIKPRREIMAEMHLRGIRHFRMHYITPAIEAGYVRMQYAEKPNYPEQAYCLTEKGIALYKELKRD